MCTILALVEVEKSLFQVAHAAMSEFGGATADAWQNKIINQNHEITSVRVSLS
jgi:hypothetical protein